jgi:hypothetical protein
MPMAGHAGSWRVRHIPVLIALLVAAPGLPGCTPDGDRDRVQASISVSPQAALVDQPVAVTVQGLPAGARTTLAARARDPTGSPGRRRPSSRPRRPGRCRSGSRR